jgi:hypothetical protein
MPAAFRSNLFATAPLRADRFNIDNLSQDLLN